MSGPQKSSTTLKQRITAGIAVTTGVLFSMYAVHSLLTGNQAMADRILGHILFASAGLLTWTLGVRPFMRGSLKAPAQLEDDPNPKADV